MRSSWESTDEAVVGGHVVGAVGELVVPVEVERFVGFQLVEAGEAAVGEGGGFEVGDGLGDGFEEIFSPVAA